jgi:hypothetical protein
MNLAGVNAKGKEQGTRSVLAQGEKQNTGDQSLIPGVQV